MLVRFRGETMGFEKDCPTYLRFYESLCCDFYFLYSGQYWLIEKEVDQIFVHIQERTTYQEFVVEFIFVELTFELLWVSRVFQ